MLWEEGDCRYKANDTVCGLQHAQANVRKSLPIFWRLLKTWSQHELPSQAQPFTPLTLSVVCGFLQKTRPQLALALALAVGFSALLHTGELLRLQAKHVHVARALRLFRILETQSLIAMRVLMPLPLTAWRFLCY